MRSFWTPYESEPVPTVREVIQHINRHGNTCFFCKQQVRGDRPTHVKTCWLVWKIKEKAKELDEN
jgi:hypothetical protein